MTKVKKQPAKPAQVKKPVVRTAKASPAGSNTVQFRLQPAMMERLLSVAEDKRTGAGVLARLWVLERLEKETNLRHTGGEAQFEPMVMVADSIKALAGALRVSNLSLDIKERFDRLEELLKKKTGVSFPRANDISAEFRKRVDQLEQEIKKKTGKTLPAASKISAEVHRRLDQLEQLVETKTGKPLPTIKDISAELGKLLERLEQELEKRTGLTLPTVDKISTEINRRIEQIESKLKPRTGVSLPRMHLPYGQKTKSAKGSSLVSKASKKKIAKPTKPKAKTSGSGS